MTKIAIVLWMLIPFCLSAKETKKVVKFIDFTGVTETYFVLRADTSIKHGSYEMERMGKILLKGFYQLGQRDSSWTQYNMEGIVRAKGSYHNNLRVGIWEFFDNKGALEQKIDYTNDLVLQYKTQFSKHQFQIHSNNKLLVSQLDRPPLFVGGSSRLQDYFAEEIRLPLHKANEKVFGTVFIGFTIDSLGVTSNFRVLKGISKVCNDEALRAIKAIPNEWIPGILEGKFVSVEYILTVIFDEKIRPVDFLPESTFVHQNSTIPGVMNVEEVHF